MNTITNLIKDILDSIERNDLYRFIAGLIMGAFFAIPLRMEACFVPMFFLSFTINFFKLWKDKGFRWQSLLYSTAGSFVIFLFTL